MDGTRNALIVASDDYTDPELRRLRAPAIDAQALAEVLRAPEIGGFEVRTLLNEPAHEVNLAVEEFFADRRPDDLLLLHFSCHGIKDESGELYFATTNTKLRRLGATAVAADFVNRRMSRSRSRRVVLLLDCCYAGAFERGMTARAGPDVGIEAQFGGRGRAVITASSAMEYAFEGEQLADTKPLAPSVFTGAIVEGLATGDADRDQDGLVALDELYDYIYDKVRAATPNQTPGKWMFGVQGGLYIARRARPVTTPAPLVPELEQAIDSPFAAVRAGAIQELARLLRGRHAGLALAARRTLERLTRDDSRMVAAAAAAALGAKAPPQPTGPEPERPEPERPEPERPEPERPKLALSATAIDFGRLPQGSASPERTVRLGNAGGGTLDARATTKASWLKLRQTDDELVIGVETATPGRHEGTVSVDSEGGSATIGVLARVDPKPAPTAATAATETHPKAAPEAEPEAAPELPEGARPGAREDVAASTAPPSAGSTAGPSAATDGARAGSARSAAEPSAAPTAAGRRPARPGRDDPRLRAAGVLAIVSAALLLLGLFMPYAEGKPLASNYAPYWKATDNIWYAGIVAALALTASVSAFAYRIRPLVGPGVLMVGPGLLLGTIAATNWVLVLIVSAAWDSHSSDGPGFWLWLVAHLLLVLAACLAGLALAAQPNRARLVPRPPRGTFPPLVVLLGVVGSAALLSQVGTPGSDPAHAVALVWAIAMALVVPTCAALAVPRRFGVALLAGWVGGGATLLPSFSTDYEASFGVVLFGCTLLVLLLIIVPFARTPA